MKKIDLTPFTIPVLIPVVDEKGAIQTGEGNSRQMTWQHVPYPFIDNIINIVLNSKQEVTARQLLERNMVCEKLELAEKSGDTELLLDQKEYEMLTLSFENFKGFGRNDVEMVKRILSAPEVE